MPRRLALLIGTHTYADPGLQKLLAPEQDTERLARALSAEAIGGFEVLPVLLDRPAADIKIAIEETLTACDREDLFLLYFTGHGVKDMIDGHLYLAAANTRLNLLESTAVSAEFLNKVMLRSRARQQVLLLDCCYSGAFARGMTVKADNAVHTLDHFSRAEAGQGRAIITASDAMQYALEGKSATGEGVQSVFTGFLVEGLESGAADLDGDGLVDVDELYDYVSRRIREAGHPQRPNGIFAQAGKLYVARNPRPPPNPALLSAGLQNALASDDPYRLLGAIVELEPLLSDSEPGLALAARRALEALAEHDSRRVSQAAARALAAHAPAPPAQPAAETTTAPAAPEPTLAPPAAPEPAPVEAPPTKLRMTPNVGRGTPPKTEPATKPGRDWILGIDFGTANVRAAVWQDDWPEMIRTRGGQFSLPAVVAGLPIAESRLVGEAAQRVAEKSPEHTVAWIKRLLGRRYHDPEVQRAAKMLPYPVSQGPNGGVRVHLGGEAYAPQEIAAMLLATVKAEAEAYLSGTVRRAVMAVPGCFDDAQRQATQDAARIAGLEVLRLINAPTAAALAFGAANPKSATLAVYSLGAGCFDVSMIEMGDGVYEVKSTAGDSALGGFDLDQRLVEWAAGRFKKQQGVDLPSVPSDRRAWQRLRGAVEKARVELSSVQETGVNLPFVAADASGARHLSERLDQARLGKLTSDLVERTLAQVHQALRDAELKPAGIDEVVLVGSVTRMGAVREAVGRAFNRAPSTRLDPETAVALGTAIYTGVLAGQVKDILVLDVAPATLAVETLGGVATPLIPRNTSIPTLKHEVFSTAADQQTSVEIKVLQGERPMAADNTLLGTFTLDGIAPAPRGTPQIEVTFALDASGLLSVSAEDKATHREQRVTIRGSGRLSDDEVEQMARRVQAAVGSQR
jgi:molecular chaperone DnaK